MEASTGEVAWLLAQLQALWHKHPSSGRYCPHVYGGYFHETDCREALILLAREDDNAIWLAVRERTTTGRWPKLAPRTKFFLAERILEAMTLCGEFLRKCNRPEARPADVPAERGQALLEWVLEEYWVDTGVRLWVELNAETYIERPLDFEE